ncbi:MAG TPA: single-stranded DNA-binding protein [Actinomycetota bacterium]|jgi:single-strand DNA-binding protein|nr:single-stranded DNA-binding protein [Actinomycetota bacterium]
MASDNTVTLVGNITDDPELRFTPSGAAVANFTVAVNRRTRNQDGTWEDRLDGFFRCNCWRDMAENVAESLTKGTRVVVVGRLQQRSWEDREGNKRYEIEVQVDEVAPSLRFASATVQKTQRSGGGRAAAPAGGGSDWGAPAGGGGGGSDWGAPSPAGGPAVEEGGF